MKTRQDQQTEHLYVQQFTDKNMTDTTKAIIYTDSDGVKVLRLAANCDLTVEEVQAKDVPDGVTSYIIDASDLPTDRTFRNAWTYTPD